MHDVTDAVASAKEVLLAARVGAGKYSMAVSHSNTITPDSVFALLVNLEISYSDGSTATLATDAKWHVTDPPITAEHLYHGESYDARLELPGWDQLGYAIQDASGNWSAAKVIEPPLGKDVVLSPRLFPPIRVVKVVKPINVTQLTARSVSYDLGNNFAGVPRVTLPAGVPAGHQMTIAVTEYPAEAAAPGKATTYGQQDTYTFSGKEKAGDTYRPLFIYHGFRYIRLDDFPGTAAEAATAAEGLFMHSDVANHGNVSIDDSTAEGRILAAVHASVVQTQACNIYSIPTDCPQREKRGWMGVS